ncbi:hypothetical protein KZ829_24475 [Actinoplanes hulinensis]|uniref:Uncharacterized protein n=1 Tax=Actinoplanes hulinensis TaxID=1144547 RepID=A0ABS7B7E4_9ACTN|nr:hypothetical protein [Actinoplanes hulinensis]MBW6436905.1 hypothetical protein [Actinoplanes hulinensis]
MLQFDVDDPAKAQQWVPWLDPTTRATNWVWVKAEDLALIENQTTVPEPKKTPDTEIVTPDEPDHRALDRTCKYGQEREYTAVVPQRLDKPIVLGTTRAIPAAAPAAGSEYGVQMIIPGMQAADGAVLEVATENMLAFVAEIRARAEEARPGRNSSANPAPTPRWPASRSGMRPPAGTGGRCRSTASRRRSRCPA